MRMWKRAVSRFLFVGGITAVLAACGASSEPSTSGLTVDAHGQTLLHALDGQVPNYLLADNARQSPLPEDSLSEALKAAEAQLAGIEPTADNNIIGNAQGFPTKADAATSAVRAVADFDGDGKADILWQTNAGVANISLISGTTVLGCYSLGTFTNQVMGTGDFNSDGKADIVWRNMSTGAVSITLMNGGTITQTLSVGQSPIALNVKLEGIGDFDGNGRADMLWRNQTTGRSVMSYHSTDGSVLSWPVVSEFINPVTTTALKVGDINGDGKDDIVWRNMGSGNVVISLMNGSTPNWRAITASPIALNVALEAIGDFDNNGKADLLWRNKNTGRSLMSYHNADGSVLTWPVVSEYINPTSTSAVGVGDFDGDGKSDILWRNLGTGNSVISLMNGSIPNWQGFSFSACSASSGPISVLAGVTAGTGNIDGVGTAARFDLVYGFAQDAAGSAYLMEWGVLRKVTASGNTSLFAGKRSISSLAPATDGAGASARFYNASKMVKDSAGNLFVLDYKAIRKVTPAGVVSTLAGVYNSTGDMLDGTGSAARFNYLSGIAIDAANNLYVTDSQIAIRKITPAGIVTTLAGSMTLGDSGFANGAGNVARFSGASDIVALANGNLIVADSGNYKLRMVTPGGDVSTFSGSGNFPPTATDGDAANANYVFINSMTSTPDGNIYIREMDYSQTSKLRRVASNGSVTTLGSLGENESGLYAISNAELALYGPGGATKLNLGTLARSEWIGKPNNASMMVDGSGATARFGTPGPMVKDAAGNLYMADNNAIRKVTPAGVVTTLATDVNANEGGGGVAATAGPGRVQTLTIDADGNLYTTEFRSYHIKKISPAGVVSTLPFTVDWLALIGYQSLVGLSVDTNGNFYVIGSRQIFKLTQMGQSTLFAGQLSSSYTRTDGTGAAASFAFISSVAIDSQCNLMVTDSGSVRKVTPAAVVTTFAGGANPYVGETGPADGTGANATFGYLGYQTAMAVDTNDNLYIGENSGLIRKVTPAGVVTTVAGSYYQLGVTPGALPGRLNAVRSLVATADKLYMVAEDVVVQISPKP
jgi:FG-GAP-like repeat